MLISKASDKPICILKALIWGFRGGSVVKNPPANVRDAGLIPGLRRYPGEGNGNPYSCIENQRTQEPGGL